ncbi:phosphonate C-P lyase system protein PhnG [Roseibium sp. AS2]|uniref:phosphonate C-P lyase system protein PhnG n=1 Tax=Roseibium sp. AS2 TaxID=3135781 RepID=UPI00317BA805
MNHSQDTNADEPATGRAQAQDPVGTSNDARGDASAARQSAMATLAAAPPETIAEKYGTLSPPAFELVRQPETGLVMVRGRMGGTGSPFNLGEVTVTRCVVRLDTGETGSAYSLGRNKQKAMHTAVIDALWQRPETRQTIENEIIAPLAAAQAAAKTTVREETEATKVNFFTMVRGDT